MERVLLSADGASPAEAASPPHRRPLHLALGVAAGVALWDFFFHEAGFSEAGFTRGAFTLAAAALVVWAHPAALATRLGRGLAAGLAAVSAAQCLEPTFLAACLSWVGLASLGLAARTPDGLSGMQWPLTWLAMAWRGWFTWLADAAAARASLARRSGWSGRLGALLGNWLLPAVLAVPFAFLFTVANPILEIGIEDVFEAIGEFLSGLTLFRLFVAALVGAGLWALLRFQARGASRIPGGELVEIGRRALGDAMRVRCLAVFNALFAVQTLLDAGYFWSGFALPDGMTYAEYAHRGAYPLVATTLLAILFILTAFREGAREDDGDRSRIAEWLVYAWLAQNAFLLASAAARLAIYIDVYQLTYFRIASAVWMLLVGTGLAWTVVKIATGRTNAWLIDVNLATAGIVLALCCFPNFERTIADYNVEQALSSGHSLDVWYLRGLGPEALPALRRWWDAGRGSESDLEFAACVNDDFLHQLEARNTGWRTFSWRRAALRDRVDPDWGQYLPECPHSC
jgi:hypothetical protein